MDETIVAERGGFRTRAELMREAVENLLDELDYPEAPPERNSHGPLLLADSEVSKNEPEQSAGFTEARTLFANLPAWEREELALDDLTATTLTAPEARPFILDRGEASVANGPLLGLHNRDYVSMWALHRLARYTADGPIPFEDYLGRITKAAWYYGAQLHALERSNPGRKLTVLFPTNSTKQPSAERGFQNFAIGTLARRVGEGIPASGPLFAWQALQVSSDNGLGTGLTTAGWRLLKELDGLSLELPHDPALMERFMTYLAEHAPGDRWGFDHLLAAAADGPDRLALVNRFRETHPEWSPATASSVAQGYVARAREWGLVEPRLIEGRYWLTDIGRQLRRESSPITATSEGTLK
ncbi:hypothetical protein CEP17_01635 [Microbacterium sp. PM5]|nr:hypothetical protein CEP17_01635 [Microbacterium sp. PM5]